MLHRDVKPPNVLLAREDHVYLSDFGLAKRADEDGGLTRQGSIVARAEYVAPEQILNERVDARADIYALGCLLFEALTGEAPFARWKEGPAQLAHLNAPALARRAVPRPASRVRRCGAPSDGEGSKRALSVGWRPRASGARGRPAGCGGRALGPSSPPARRLLRPGRSHPGLRAWTNRRQRRPLRRLPGPRPAAPTRCAGQSLWPPWCSWPLAWWPRYRPSRPSEGCPCLICPAGSSMRSLDNELA